MKEIYSFTVSKNKEVEVKEETEKGTLLKKETQSVPFKIIIKKPSRIEIEEADSLWAVEWSNAVKMGILTKPQLAKIYSDSGGFLTKDDADEYLSLHQKYSLAKTEQQLLMLKGEGNKEELEKKGKDLTDQLTKIYLEIQGFENRQSQVFDQTAEVRARNKTIQWLLLNLTYIEENESQVQFFKGSTYEDKIDNYFDMLELESDFTQKVIEKATFFVSIWYMSRAATREDFESAEKQIQAL